MTGSPIRSHLPALAIVVIVIIAGIIVLPSLPEEVVIHYDSAGNPDAYGPSTVMVLLFSLFISGMFVFTLLLDVFLIYPVLPGKMMGAINAIASATISVIYGTALAMELGIIENINIGIAFGLLTVLVVCFILYFLEVRRLDESVGTLGSAEYFEKTRPSWFYYLFFLSIPLVPRYLLLSSRGIGIMGALYRITIPWYDIESVTAMKVGEKAGLPVKIYHTFTNLVLIRISGKKASLIISPERRDEYLRIAGEFMVGNPRT